MVRSTWRVTAALLLAGGTAHAGKLDARQAFTVGGEVGAAGRYVEDVSVRDADAWGLLLGARAEVNLLLHARADVQYIEGRAFNADDDRLFTVSVSARTPKLFMFALDLHELYARASTRPGDRLTYAHTGLGIVGDALGTFKGGLGFTYLSAANVPDTDLERAYGAYLGAEYLLRTRFLHTSLRGTLFVAFHDKAEPHAGAMIDGDVMIRIPAGPVAVGPRLDVGYRNLGFSGNELFGQSQEMTATLGVAVDWGTGDGNRGRRPRDRRRSDEGGATAQAR